MFINQLMKKGAVIDVSLLALADARVRAISSLRENIVGVYEDDPSYR